MSNNKTNPSINEEIIDFPLYKINDDYKLHFGSLAKISFVVR